MEDFTTFICYELKMTMKKVEKTFTQILKEYGVNFAQSLILFCLLEKDGSTLSEIGSRAQIENSSLTTMVDRLEKDGLVARRLDPQDRRAIRLFLTKGGKQVGEKIFDEGLRFNKLLAENLGESKQSLVKALSIISASLE